MDTVDSSEQGVSLDSRGSNTPFNSHAMFLNTDGTGSSILDKNGDERFGLILTEVLRLRTQVSSLQAQIAAITHERDSASMLIWTEVSRLAQQLEQMDGIRGELKNSLTLPADTVSPTGHLGETQDIKYTDPVIIRTLLGDSSGCMQHKMNADPHDNSMSLSSNDASQCDKGLIDIRLKHIKKRGRNSLNDSDTVHKKIPLIGNQNELVVNELFNSTDNSTIDGNKQKSPDTIEITSDDLISQWIDKQRMGEKKRPDLAIYKEESESEWWCHVCDTMARDGPPGEHFCFSKIENGSRDGLKVICHYCKKGTSRMPDLRVHFKKIVYCKLLRRELTKKYLASENSTTSTKEESFKQRL